MFEAIVSSVVEMVNTGAFKLVFVGSVAVSCAVSFAGIVMRLTMSTPPAAWPDDDYEYIPPAPRYHYPTRDAIKKMGKKRNRNV